MPIVSVIDYDEVLEMSSDTYKILDDNEYLQETTQEEYVIYNIVEALAESLSEDLTQIHFSVDLIAEIFDNTIAALEDNIKDSADPENDIVKKDKVIKELFITHSNRLNNIKDGIKSNKELEAAIQLCIANMLKDLDSVEITMENGEKYHINSDKTVDLTTASTFKRFDIEGELEKFIKIVNNILQFLSTELA